MTYEVVQPPTTEQELAKLGKEILETAEKLGRPMDVEGFLQSWLGGTRVVAERDASGNITGLALVAVGRRWLFQDYAASVIWYKAADTKALLNYIRMIANALGAKYMYVESEDPLETTDEYIRCEIKQYILRK